MKTSRLFLLSSAFIAHCCSVNAQSPSDITIGLSRNPVPAGESVTISWSVGTNAIGSGDWVSVYATNAPDPAPGGTAISGFRASTSGHQVTLSPLSPGSYELRYVRASTNTPVMYRALVRGPILNVFEITNQVISVSTNRLTVRESVAIEWTAPPNSIGSSDWVSVYYPGTPDPAPAGTSLGGVRASTFGHQWTPTFLLAGTYELRYVRPTSTNSGFYRALTRGPTITVQEPVADATTVRNYPSAGQNIIAFGDSLVQGVGSTPDEDMVSEMIRRLCCRPILNNGVSGNTTAEALLRLQSDVLSQNPKIVIVVLGGNDFIQGIDPETTYTNLKSIITQIHTAGAIVVLVGIEAGRFTTSFAPYYRRLAFETGCAYVPNVLLNVWGNTRLMASIFDVHPNSEGYEVMAKRIAPTVGLLDAGSAPAPFAAAAAAGKMVELSWGLLSGTECVLESGSTATFTGASPILTIKRVGDNLVIGINPASNQAFFRLERVPTPVVIENDPPENPEAAPEEPSPADGSP